MHMIKPTTTLVAALKRSRAIRGKSQAELSSETGVPQYQISRILSGKVKRHTPALLRLCKYAHVKLESARKEDPEGRRLIELALLNSWDGSQEKARKIARLLMLAADMH